mgnify:CR=1 FL=1
MMPIRNSTKFLLSNHNMIIHTLLLVLRILLKIWRISKKNTVTQLNIVHLKTSFTRNKECYWEEWKLKPIEETNNCLSDERKKKHL